MIYPYAQKKFSRTHRAQRKFRVEPVRSAAKLARSHVDSSEEVMRSAQSGSCQTNRLRLLGHYRMARMSQSASSYGLASWMRPQQLRHFSGSGHSFAKIFIRFTICQLLTYSFLINFLHVITSYYNQNAIPGAAQTGTDDGPARTSMFCEPRQQRTGTGIFRWSVDVTNRKHVTQKSAT